MVGEERLRYYKRCLPRGWTTCIVEQTRTRSSVVLHDSIKPPFPARGSRFRDECGDHRAAYLNSGSILSPSLVPPGNITLFSANFSVS
jgi:hypothetical protein